MGDTKYFCVVDANCFYSAYVLARVDGEKIDVIGYNMQDGERLVESQTAPDRKLHAGSSGFVKPRWDEDAAAWVEGATAEELAAWEAAHPDPVSLEEKRAAKHMEISTASEAAIEAGMDVETTHGVEHFSLEKNDQINLTTAVNTVQ